MQEREASPEQALMGGLWRKIGAGLLLAVLVYSALAFATDWDELSKSLTDMRWRYIPLVLALASLNYLTRFVKWHYLVRHLGIRVPLGTNLIIFLAGLFMSVTPGKMGEILKSYLLKRTYGTPISKSAPVVFAERLTDLIALLILAVLGGYALSGAGVYLVLGIVLVASLLAIVGIEPVHVFLLKRMAGIRRLESIAHKADQSFRSARSLVMPKPLLLSSLVSIPAWFCECLGFWLILKASGIDSLDLARATGVYGLAAVVGALSMLPGGLGATEITLTGLLSASGIAKGAAIASTLVVRAATLWYAVLVGAVFLGVFMLFEIQSPQSKPPLLEEVESS